jgi:hypothetical protein
MKMKVVTIAVLVVVAMLMVASVALAASSTSPTAIINDAQDGHIDGNYTAAQVRAALSYLKSDPTLQQYTDVEGVLQDFLASLRDAGVQGVQNGGLMFTGGSTVVLFAFGVALMGGGFVLRRRHA